MADCREAFGRHIGGGLGTCLLHQRLRIFVVIAFSGLGALVQSRPFLFPGGIRPTRTTPPNKSARGFP